MELIIYAPTEDGFIKSIDWNFEDLKKEISEKAKTYMNLVYSDDQMKEAKKDRADLNKFKKALNNKKIEIKDQVMEPYKDFEEKIKELMGIVDQAVQNVDDQIKGYEEGLRQEKDKKCEELWLEIVGDLDRTVPYEKIRKEEWLKRSVSMKAIREDMVETIARIDKELKLIGADFSKYIFEMKEEYLKAFDFSAAMAIKQHLEETEKKKALFEAEQEAKEAARKQAMEAEAQKVQEAGNSKIEITEDGDPVVVPQEKKEKTLAITFQVTARQSQFAEVNRLLQSLKNAADKLEIIEKEEL